MIEKILEMNGLSPKEAKIYIAILELGETPLSRIASKTGLKRTTVYSVVDALRTRDILFVLKRRGIQYISALPPKVLVERFQKSAHLAEQLLPQLLEMAYNSPLKPRLRFFEGIDGLKEILREFSHATGTSFGFTDYEKMPKDLFQFIRKEVIAQRKKMVNRAQFIIPANPTNLEVQKQDAISFTEHRVIRFETGQNPIELLLFENSKVAFLSFIPSEMFGVILDSPAIYHTLKNIFLLIWNTSQTD